MDNVVSREDPFVLVWWFVRSGELRTRRTSRKSAGVYMQKNEGVTDKMPSTNIAGKAHVHHSEAPHKTHGSGKENHSYMKMEMCVELWFCFDAVSQPGHELSHDRVNRWLASGAFNGHQGNKELRRGGDESRA